MEGPCWLWTGARQSGGYGLLKDGDGPQLAHRISYELHVGPIPEGLEIDHLCRVRACVNPDHIEAVTRAENLRRGRGNRNAGRARCIRGHPFTKANTYTATDQRGYVHRKCRACHLGQLAKAA